MFGGVIAADEGQREHEERQPRGGGEKHEAATDAGNDSFQLERRRSDDPVINAQVMKPEDIVQALEGRGWKAEIVNRADVDDLVGVDAEGLFKCVDGRASDHPGMRGPKVLGGVYAVASMRDVRDLEGLKAIVAEVKAAGYVPSVHGDEHADPAPMGCGYFKLWVTGQLEGLEPPSFTAEEGKAAVLEAGGVYEQLKGSHSESEVLINLVPKTTFEPKPDQRFVVDAWVAVELGLDVPGYLVRGAETVEKLNGPKVARIVVG